MDLSSCDAPTNYDDKLSHKSHCIFNVKMLLDKGIISFWKVSFHQIRQNNWNHQIELNQIIRFFGIIAHTTG